MNHAIYIILCRLVLQLRYLQVHGKPVRFMVNPPGEDASVMKNVYLDTATLTVLYEPPIGLTGAIPEHSNLSSKLTYRVEIFSMRAYIRTQENYIVVLAKTFVSQVAELYKLYSKFYHESCFGVCCGPHDKAML